MEELEIYDPVEGKPMMIIYMAKSGEKWIKLSGDRLVEGVLTRVLRTSYSYRPIEKCRIKIGERLECHIEEVGNAMRVYSVVPTEWVVVKVERYEPILEDIPEFRGIAIAYCEIQAMFYKVIPKISVDSFGGDSEAYHNFLESDEAKRYVRTNA